MGCTYVHKQCFHFAFDELWLTSTCPPPKVTPIALTFGATCAPVSPSSPKGTCCAYAHPFGCVQIVVHVRATEGDEICNTFVVHVRATEGDATRAPKVRTIVFASPSRARTWRSKYNTFFPFGEEGERFVRKPSTCTRTNLLPKRSFGLVTPLFSPSVLGVTS